MLAYQLLSCKGHKQIVRLLCPVNSSTFHGPDHPKKTCQPLFPYMQNLYWTGAFHIQLSSPPPAAVVVVRRFWHPTQDSVVPYVDHILHRDRFCAISIASGSVRLWDLRSCCTVLSHVMRGRPRGLLQLSYHLRYRPKKGQCTTAVFHPSLLPQMASCCTLMEGY